ncbi:hypothetical protein OS242_11305 [Tumebacillus sp. DT12]|uniref:DUF4230 domain-containing protein n=1 Tax=Tumebacillus lacus TaxID=2995335 RepID=A0ABT3X4N9_9BACL|nr:hypothetical protein [Tumebacillus lacus]MCX7570550.1 hypothetical protein [Tumebacillus lacus]
MKDEEYEVGNSSDTELPSRSAKHKKRGGNVLERVKRIGDKAKAKPPHKEEERETAFYEALQTYREQAAGTALAETLVEPLPEEDRRERRGRFSRRLIVGLLACSLLINLGQGILVYKLIQKGIEKDNTFATPQPTPVTTPKPVPDVVRIVQPIHWTPQQLSGISKDRRTTMEETFTLLYNNQRFAKGNLNMLYVSGLNSFVVHHDGSLGVSVFLHNGYLKNFTPKAATVSIYYQNRLMVSGTFEKKIPQLMAGEIYLVDLLFKPDDIRDPDTVDKLALAQGELAKMRFDVRISYDNVITKDLVEEVWMILTPQVALAPKLPQ